jgi:hypothetical protein
MAFECIGVIPQPRQSAMGPDYYATASIPVKTFLTKIQGGLSNYDPATNTLQVAGYGGVGESVGVQRYLKNFGPRAGASYSLNDKTVLRGGYGVSTLPFPDNSYVYNYPVKQNNVFNAPNNFASAGSMKNGFPDPVFVAIPANGIIDASPAGCQRCSSTCGRHAREGSAALVQCGVSTRELARTIHGDTRPSGTAARRQTPVQRKRREGAPAGEQRPAAFTVRQVRDVTTWIGTKRSTASLQAELDRRFTASRDVASAGARVELPTATATP